MSTLNQFSDEYIVASRPPEADQPPMLDWMDLTAEELCLLHRQRYPGAYSSDEPTPYEKSGMLDSKIERDREENPRRLYNSRKPYIPLKREKYEHRDIAFFKAQGLTNKEIAEKTGYSTFMISNILRQPWTEQEVLRIIEEQGGGSVREFFEQKATEAAVRLAIEMNNPEAKPSERISAAEKILDRAFGKPTQALNHTINGRLEQMSDEELERILQSGSDSRTATATS